MAVKNLKKTSKKNCKLPDFEPIYVKLYFGPTKPKTHIISTEIKSKPAFICSINLLYDFGYMKRILILFFYFWIFVHNFGSF